ncbi:colicin E1 family microcin immunity protein [Edwardsiella tarda]|uniref:colicin E1 family microcin immunity protein n=1 Tax=Edwardsiella tarda TaxID=636 RepID=UPI003C6EEACC
MNLRYYIRNICWGLFIALISLYQWTQNPIDTTNQYMLVFSIASAPLLPFSKKAIECFALKFTKESFWHKGFFSEDIGKNGLYAIYYLACFILAIPIGLPYSIYLSFRKVT